MVADWAKRVSKRYNLSRLILGLVFIAAFLLHNTGAIQLPFVNAIENKAYDMRLNINMSNEKDHRIVILDIDEKSLDAEGRWPWGRDKLATMVQTLFDDYFVASVGFDVLFIEEDNSSGIGTLNRLIEKEFSQQPEVKKALESVRPELENDRLFGESLRDREVVLGFFMVPEGSAEGMIKKGQLPEPVEIEGGLKGKFPIPGAIGYGASLPILTENAIGAGFVDKPLLDDDGVIRRVIMLQEYEGSYYPSLSLAVVRSIMGNPPVGAFVAPGYEGSEINLGLERLEVGGLKIPVDASSSLYVPYRGPGGSFPYVSATDVLSGTTPKEVLDGAIVLVGSSAAGLLDLRSTPVQNVYPGVEVHANVISGILDEAIMQSPDYVQGMEFLLLAVVGVLMLSVLPWLSALWVSLLSLTVVAALFGLNIYLWNEKLLLPLAPSVLLVSLLFIKHVSYGYFTEQNTKKRLHRSFGQYIPPELVDELSEAVGNGDVTLDAESRELTVLFSDVRGFTSLSEGLSPKELSNLMNQFLTPMTGIIHHRRGTIDKYMGDAIMAFWGAPIRDDNHALHAVQAALAMINVLPEINRQFEAKGWPAINIGVGLNTGTMSVGNMGSEFRMAYTVLGDAVNLGSRLEGLTKKYGVRVIISDSTKHAIENTDIVLRTLDKVKVVGKDEAVEIYEPLGLKSELSTEQMDKLARYHSALARYRNQDWELALKAFQDLVAEDPDTLLYDIYVARTLRYMEEPPEENWDCVFTFHSK